MRRTIPFRCGIFKKLMRGRGALSRGFTPLSEYGGWRPLSDCCLGTAVGSRGCLGAPVGLFTLDPGNRLWGISTTAVGSSIVSAILALDESTKGDFEPLAATEFNSEIAVTDIMIVSFLSLYFLN